MRRDQAWDLRETKIVDQPHRPIRIQDKGLEIIIMYDCKLQLELSKDFSR